MPPEVEKARAIIDHAALQQPAWWAALLAVLGIAAIIWYLRTLNSALKDSNAALRDSNLETRRSNDRTIELLTGVIKDTAEAVKGVDVRLEQVECKMDAMARDVARLSVDNR